MSRRLIFVVTSCVVLLYFIVIIFILRPLHGRGGMNGGYMNGFAFREIPALSWCKALRWRTPPGPVTALVSFPGSGNTWLRYLLQQATGILTGSIYMDYGLRVHGFPAENVTDGSVLVVKTHGHPPVEPGKFQAAILLIRDPADAILADFNRLHKGHIGTAPKSAFRLKRDGKNTDWSNYVRAQLPAWESLAVRWLQWPGAKLVLRYERLVAAPRATLRQVLDFLNQTVSEEDMNCAMYNREGIYRRRRKLPRFDPYTAGMRRALAAASARLDSLLDQYERSRSRDVLIVK